MSIEFFNGRLILGIVTKQITSGDDQGYIIISFFDSSLSPGTYYYPGSMNFSIGWLLVLNNCFTPIGDTTIKKWGNGVLTKFDNVNGIVSGTFEFKFKAQNCDTVRVTDGRFDVKL